MFHNAAKAREANEAEKRQQLVSALVGLNMYKMREKLKREGLRNI